MNTSDYTFIATFILGGIFIVLWWFYRQSDAQRQSEITKLEALIKETAKLVLDEKDKTAELVLRESRLNAALVLTEKDKLEARFKEEYKELDEKLTAHRILIAEKYATSALVEKIMLQVTAPLVKELEEIKGLLGSKVDRREFEAHPNFRKS